MIKVVAGLIIDCEQRILACRRADDRHLGGKWEFPGGKLESDESPNQALVRELQEELGITVKPGRMMTPVVHDYGRGPIQLIPIVCSISFGEPQAIEHSEIRWCHVDELSQLDLAAADLPILAEWKQSAPQL